MTPDDAISDYLLQRTVAIREELKHSLAQMDFPIEAFEEIGCIGIAQLHERGMSRQESTFANSLTEHIEFMPLEVVQAHCLAAAYLMVGLSAYKAGEPYGLEFILLGGEEIGFLRGAVFGLGYIEPQRKQMLSASGSQGAAIRHRASAALKEWAIEEAKKMRGADRDIARKLSAQLPPHLADVSKDPLRLIYESLRKKP